MEVSFREVKESTSQSIDAVSKQMRNMVLKGWYYRLQWGSHQKQTELPHQVHRIPYLWEDWPLCLGVYVLPEQWQTGTRSPNTINYVMNLPDHHHLLKEQKTQHRIHGKSSKKRQVEMTTIFMQLMRQPASSGTSSESATTSSKESNVTESKDDASYVID